MSMALWLNRNNLPSLGQRRQERPHHADRHHATWNKDERPASAVDLVIHLETVDCSVSAGARASTCLRVRRHDVAPLALGCLPLKTLRFAQGRAASCLTIGAPCALLCCAVLCCAALR